MSGILLATQQILLPRLNSATTAWTASAASPGPATSSIIPTNTGGLTAIRSGGAGIDLNRWLPFTFSNVLTANFELMLTILAGAAGWTNSGAWQNGGSIFQFDGLVFADTVSVVRLDVRLVGPSPILATQTYTITFDII